MILVPISSFSKKTEKYCQLCIQVYQILEKELKRPETNEEGSDVVERVKENHKKGNHEY